MTSPDPERADARADAAAVQAFLRERARHGVLSGPFSILLSRGDRGAYANYAIPADDAAPTAAEIAELEEAFRSRHRQPRLEYVPDAAPAVEPALLAAGFTVELRPPLMTRRAGPAPPQPDLPDFELTFAETPEALAEAVRIQAAAFGGEESEAQWMTTLPERGGRVMLARHRDTGEPAGVGAYIPPLGGVTEVVGIGVPTAWRQRGLGQVITARLAEAAFDAGCSLAFLSAAGEPQTRIYERSGFTVRAPMLFISKPDG